MGGLKGPYFGRSVRGFKDIRRDKEPDGPQDGGAEDEKVEGFDGRLSGEVGWGAEGGRKEGRGIEE